VGVLNPWRHTDADGDTVAMRPLPPADWRPDVVAVFSIESEHTPICAAYVTTAAARALYEALGELLDGRTG
jgi:hypothetical protein